MAKAETKKTVKPNSKREQYQRFRETARDHDADDEESAQKFERALSKIVPAKRKDSS